MQDRNRLSHLALLHLMRFLLRCRGRIIFFLIFEGFMLFFSLSSLRFFGQTDAIFYHKIAFCHNVSLKSQRLNNYDHMITLTPSSKIEN